MKKNCDVCNNDLKTAIKFSDSPYGDNYFKKKKESINAKKYPLKLMLCEKCMFCTLEKKINPEYVAESFLYTSNITSGLIESYQNLVDHLLKNYEINSVLDIGSNDGSFLEIFSKKGIETIGIEPANHAANISREKGINTISSFFDKNIIKNLSRKSFDLISANYMFANVYDINEFLINMRLLLSEKGKILITTGYHPEQFKKGMIDYIYHEHFHYFSAKSMNLLLEKHNFFIDEIIPIKNKLSSLCFVASKKEGEILSSREAERYIDFEIKNEFNLKKTIVNLKNKYDNELEIIKKELVKVKSEGKKIFGFGASLSTSIFLSENNIGQLIDLIIDDNQYKWNRFSPGFGIKVGDPKMISNNPENVIVILAWQHSETILKKYSYNLSKVRWIIPFA